MNSPVYCIPIVLKNQPPLIGPVTVSRFGHFIDHDWPHEADENSQSPVKDVLLHSFDGMRMTVVVELRHSCKLFTMIEKV